jgi:hypothetical protein
VNLRRSAVLVLVLSAAVMALAGCGKSKTYMTAAPIIDPPLAPAPPMPPSNLSGGYDSATERDYLQWAASPSASVTSYEVWEAASDPVTGGTLAHIANVSAAQNQYVLPAATADVNKFYELRAADGAGALSAYTAPVVVARHYIPPGVSGTGGGGGGAGKRIGE